VVRGPQHPPQNPSQQLSPQQPPPPALPAAAAAAVDLQGVEADLGGHDEDELPAAELVQRLAQAPVGQPLPAQQIEGGAGAAEWDEGVGVAAEQAATLAHARQVKAQQRLTEKQLLKIVRPQTRSCTKAAGTDATTSAGQASTSRAVTGSEEDSSEEEDSQEGNSEEECSGEGCSDDE